MVSTKYLINIVAMIESNKTIYQIDMTDLKDDIELFKKLKLYENFYFSLLLLFRVCQMHHILRFIANFTEW